MSHLLEVQDLHVEFRTRDGVARVLNGVSCHVDAGETLALLGESGSGKSVTAQAIMGILDSPPAAIRSGRVLLEGRDLLALPESARREVRGKSIAMVFQDSLSALNPVFPVGWQIGEALRVRAGLDRKSAALRAIELMERVRIPSAASRARDYPHQFSGGMRQRVMIAMALALDPKVLIADEPTTALDVTVQAQIMDLLMELKNERGMALILITHDLGVVAQVADRIQTGDVLAFATSIPGLDVTHSAMAYRDDTGVLRVLHAPLSGGSVEITRSTLPEYVAAIKRSTGILVARPV